MPTAGRLAGAIAFAAFGYYLYTLLSPLFEEGQEPQYFLKLCVGVGVWAGWVICGKRASDGYKAGIGTGFTAVAAMAFWIVFLMSFADMIKKSMRKLYDGPMEALVDVFSLMLDAGAVFATADVGIALAIGGFVCGFFTSFIGKRFS